MERYYKVALSMINGLGSKRTQILLNYFGTAEAAWQNDWQEVEGIPTNVLREFSEVKKKTRVENLEAELAQKQVRILLKSDPEYPALLKEIESAPQILYLKGSLKEFTKGIAVVGARKCTTYGRAVAERLSEELAEAGISIVSGGARGIDTCAHKGALKKGPTFAVLGSGVDIVYPPENRGLFAQIAESGALISEYPLGMPPMAGNFPARNRLLSGLCEGTLVIEAATQSGSLITAHLALEQNREVFAIPGSILSESSGGTNQLIQQGAKLVVSVQDILEEIGEKGKMIAPKIKKEFTESEKLILSILKADEPLLLETISELSGIDWGKASLLLLEMEIEGLVKNEGLQGYIRKVSL